VQRKPTYEALERRVKGLEEEALRRKGAEKALRESEERWRSLVENSPDFILNVDRTGKILFVNQTLRALTPEEAIGTTVFEYVPRVYHDIMREVYERVFRTGIAESYRTEGPAPDGGRAHYETRVEPIERNGRVVTLNLVSTNITDRKRAEDELGRYQEHLEELVEKRTGILKKEIIERKRAEARINKLNQELEQRVKERTADLQKALDELKKLDEMKDSFLSSISHEFRTPLTSIRSFSEILLEYEDEDPNTQKEFLHIINSESERLSRLVNDLLDLSQIDSGRMVYRDEVMSLEEVVREAARIQFPSLHQKSLRLILDLPSDLPSVLADRDRTKQVIANLLHNAITFSLKEGEIRIEAEALEDEGSGEPNGWILVRVSDQGVGIEEKDLARVFEKFNQGSSDTLRDKPKGTGLGLPISKEIITHYGGDMWVESQKMNGSTFFFTLPAAPRQDESAGQGLPEEDSSRNQPHG